MDDEEMEDKGDGAQCEEWHACVSAGAEVLDTENQAKHGGDEKDFDVFGEAGIIFDGKSVR